MASIVTSINQAAALYIWKSCHDQDPVLIGGSVAWREAVWRRVEEIMDRRWSRHA